MCKMYSNASLPAVRRLDNHVTKSRNCGCQALEAVLINFSSALYASGNMAKHRMANLK